MRAGAIIIINVLILKPKTPPKKHKGLPIIDKNYIGSTNKNNLKNLLYLC